MAIRRPLVLISGATSELPFGDEVTGVTAGVLVAGSGLDGGGSLNTNNVTINVSLTASSSGLIFAGNSLGLDGVAQSVAYTALSSGNAALTNAATALASGNAALTNAATALASGNAALVNAGAALASGNAALSDLGNKYDKVGGPISGPIIVQSQSIGTSRFINSSGVCIFNFGTGNNFEVVLTATTSTFATPLNASGGQTGIITLRQDNTGSRLVAYSGAWRFVSNTPPTLTTTASGVDALAYYVVNPGRILATSTLNYGSGTVF